jgi:hypothetical protein
MMSEINSYAEKFCYLVLQPIFLVVADAVVVENTCTYFMAYQESTHYRSFRYTLV